MNKTRSLKLALATIALLALPLSACTPAPAYDAAMAAAERVETPPAELEKAIEIALADHDSLAVATEVMIELADMRRAYPFHTAMSPAEPRLEAMEMEFMEGTVDKTLTEVKLIALVNHYAVVVQHAAVQYGVLEMPGS